MAMTLLVLVLAAAAATWLRAPAKPQPVQARRNLLQEELLAAYINQHEPSRRW